MVPADTSYNATEASLNVTTIAAQNRILDGHAPGYDIGAGGNSDLFNMTGSTLFFESAPASAGVYAVNVTAFGGDFGAGNHKILNITVTDTEVPGTAPTFGSATYNTGTGVLQITFSEALSGTADLAKLHVRESGASTGGAVLTGATSQSTSGAVLTVTLAAGQKTTVNALATPQLDITAGAVTDGANPIADSADNAISVTDGTAPTFGSATYNTGTGVLQITFSEALSGTADLAKLHVRESGESTGGAVLTGATSQSTSGAVLTVTLAAGQKTTVNALATPQLDITAGAVTDGANPIADSADNAISVTDPDANSPPVVEAGADQEVAEGATVSLSGTATDDDLEDDLTYSWTHDGALTIAITGSDSLSASFTAPNVAANTTITVTLTVSDGTVEVSDALQVNITDSPSIPPAVDAGLNLTAADSITNTGALELYGAWGITTFESGGSTYAAVAAYNDDGIQILDVTNPFSITAAGSIANTGDLELDGAQGIATFESGGSTYAAVAAYDDDGVQILNITDPSAITAAGSIANTGDLELDGARAITTFESGDSTYAAVASFDDDGVQILDITDPSNVTAAGSITDPADNFRNDDALELNGARGIATFESGGGTYAAVTAYYDDGVQILDITDPSDITAVGSITDTGTLELNGARGIATFESGDSTYAAVAAYWDDGVQILDITDPSDITAVGSININSTDALLLDGPSGITTFAAGGSTYAAVTSFDDDGVQILDITDPSDITAAGSITDTAALELRGAEGITTFESGGSTYAAVAAHWDDGVQILRLAGDGAPPVTLNSPPTVEAGPDQTVGEGATVSLSGTVSDDDSGDTLTYSWTHDGPSGITFANPAALSTSFTAPSVAANTTVTVTLTVDDGTVDVSDTLQVNITDSPGLNLPAAGSITDAGTLKLLGARAITTFESGGSTYAAVASFDDDGVQILDITDPFNVAEAGSIADDGTNNDELELNGARGIATFESGGSTYAAVASFDDDGVQILDITDPSNVTAAGSITDTVALELDGAYGIATFESGGSTYAAVTAYLDDGVQILNITDPSAITAAGSIDGTALELDGARGIATFESGGSTYAAVASFVDRGVQILDITDPSAITAAGSITDTATLVLRGASGIATFESGGSTYAAVTVYQDDGIQILNITDPSSVTAAGSITDTVALELRGAEGITTFESGGSTYAAVASRDDDGVQILDITDPSNVTAAGSITDTATLVLRGASGIATFESGGSTYAAVASRDDDGVQILRLAGDGAPPVTLNSPPVVEAGADQEVAEGATVSLSGTATDDDLEDDLTYSWTHDGALTIAITGSDSLSASFTAPNVAANTTITVTLTVSDGTVEVSDALQVNITDSPGLNLPAAGSITDAGTLKLLGARAITTFESGGSTYAAVASFDDDGVQILDITDPFNVAEAGSIADDGTNNDELELNGARGIATFESGGSTYAAVTAYHDDGVQILDITDPSNVTAADSITDDAALELYGAWGITTFESGGSTYAAVAAYWDDGVQILNITDPSDITAAGSITDTDALELLGAYGIATFESGGSTYAAVAAYYDDGVQILDITDPSDITAAGSITDTDALELLGAYGIATFESGGSTYAAVASFDDDGVQILDITDPSDITAAGSITDTAALELYGAQGIATFESGGSTYAAVAAYDDDGVQILDITDPSDITAAGSITDTATLVLRGASGIATFESGGSTYAAVASRDDDGVQILRLAGDGAPPVTLNSPPEVEAGDDQEVAEGATVALSGTASDDDSGDTLTYSWTHDGDPAITITGSDSLSASFTAPDVAADTTITVTLTVDDGTVEVSDTLQVTIADSPNSSPTVNAGQDQEVVEGATVALSGTASDDDPEDTLTYSWIHDSSLAITFANSTALSTSFTAPGVAANTTFTVTLTVNDGTVGVSDTLQVTIADSPNSSPTVNAGQDQEVAEGATVSLSGTVSDDDQEDTLTYSWTHDSSLAITFANSTALSTSFTAPGVAANTTFTVTLTVNDGTVGVSDALQVTIADSPNSPPEVGAGADQEVAEGATVALSGTASDDDQEDTLTYSWTHDSSLAITFANSTALSTSFTAPGVAANTTFTVTLTVNDGTVGVSDALQVTIADSPSIPVVVPPPEGAFVTTWKADTSPDTVSIPVRVHSGGTVTIHWGDGSNSTVSGNGTQTHTYQDSGQYQVAMTGDLSRIIMGGSGSTPDQLLSIDQWGDGTWGSMQDAFKEAVNMEYKATDTPDLSGVTSMLYMFRDTFFTGNLSGWNVSNVETMKGMFYDANHFDGNLSGWNVSAVTDMHSMFRGAHTSTNPFRRGTRPA